MRAMPAAAAMAAALCSISGAASADPRLRNLLYVKNEIVTLQAKPGIESAIAFAPDERIENIAVGNSAKWDVNPNKRANVIFFKPSAVHARTNMTVITNQRTYMFDLVSSARAAPLYMLQFTYPDAPKPAPAAAPPQNGPDAVAQASVPPPQAKAAPAALNFAWRATGEKRLLPLSYFDDGSSTFLHWPADVALPAILVRGFDGTEGPVNYTVRDDYVVVDGVPAQIILRSGKQVAALTQVRGVSRPTQTAAVETARVRADAGRADK